MNDPLLPIDPLLIKTAHTMYPPPAPHTATTPQATTPQTTIAPAVAKRAPVPMRKKHPALSARILAVGLSTTAFIGMTSGYTLAQKQPATQPIVQDPTTPVSAATPANAAPQATTAVQDATPQATPSVAPSATQVIQVPVPVTASAATPGTAAPVYQPAQTQQKSSGSN
jgi:hypothetical protein